MITPCYVSPSDQALGSIRIAEKFGIHDPDRLAKIGAITHAVMEIALLFPDEGPDAWAERAQASVPALEESPADGRDRLMKKAEAAACLLELGLLVGDEQLAQMTIDNNFRRPARVRC